MNQHNHIDLEALLETVKVFIICAASFTVRNYHTIAGDILVTLSILYLAWKWRRDVRREKQAKTQKQHESEDN